MEEIDILKECREYKKGRIKDYISSTKGKVNISCCFISLVPFVFPNRPICVDLLVLSNFFINSFNVVSNLKSYMDTTYKTHELVTQSEEYTQCVKLYNMYISEIAMFLKSFGFKNSRELVFFLLTLYETNCLTSGTREYHNYKYGKDILLDDFGIRAVTGKCVCRHTSHFFSDILNAYGAQCCNLSVSLIKGDVDKINPDKIKYNHMVNGIVDDGKKYIFDGTSYDFFCRGDNEMYPKSCLDESYLAVSNKSVLFNSKYLKSYEAFKNSTFAELDRDELLAISGKQMSMFADNIQDIMEFVINNRDLVYRISDLINKINPLDDKPIRKWFVK